MKPIKVNTKSANYELRIAPGLLEGAGAIIAPLLNRKFVAIISDETVASLYIDPLKASLKASGIESFVVTIPEGEGSKSWAETENIVEALLEARVEREDLIIALGGGVVGDLAGFVAAILRRGVRLVQMPTTLLAQVDSAIGGKTGINSRHGKNLIGAFHQPALVLSDVALLSSLTPRDYLSGYGEVIKYALLGDAKFFDWLEENTGPILEKSRDGLAHMISRSAQMKADIVARDEKEMGERALLNLGHTFAHALERVTGYSERLLHGEAVAIGCALAADLSARLGYTRVGTGERIRNHLDHMGMKSRISQIDGEMPGVETLLEAMYQDKKVKSGALNFILLHAIGNAFIARGVDADVVRDLLSQELAGANMAGH